MSEKKSFSELLEEAPLASAEKTVCITGVLARSNDPGKFVLTTGDNQTITLDVDAVKEHRILSGMVGQLVVQVEVDKDRVPKMAHAHEEIRTNPFYDQHRTAPIADTSPRVDQYIYKNINENNGTIQENVIDPGNFGVDPALGQGFAPFALATPSQVPQAMFREAAPGFHTGIWDLQTIHRYDKSPLTDFTGWGVPEQSYDPAVGAAAGAVPPIWNPQLGASMGPIRTSPFYDQQSVHYLDKLPIMDITGHFPYPD
jgi:hypothetical protein